MISSQMSLTGVENGLISTGIPSLCSFLSIRALTKSFQEERRLGYTAEHHVPAAESCSRILEITVLCLNQIHDDRNSCRVFFPLLSPISLSLVLVSSPLGAKIYNLVDCACLTLNLEDFNRWFDVVAGMMVYKTITSCLAFVLSGPQFSKHQKECGHGVQKM